MTRRASRRAELFEPEKRRLLILLGQCRDAVIEGQRHLKPGCETYQLGTAVLASVDALATLLTGDPQHFWTKPHGR